MKLLVSVNQKELSNFLEFTNSFLIGLKNYSVNYFEFSIEEIKELKEKYENIELFVSINKNIFNSELEDIKEKLKELNKIGIKGILFYDISLLSLVKKLNLDLDLCFHQTHMVTNYNICNYYYSHGVKYAYLSTEITALEMKEISEKTKMDLMAYFIGHPIISHSKRKLVSNFYEFNKKDKKNSLKVIKEKNGKTNYYIKEDSLGTNILTYDILNGARAFTLIKNYLSYAILDSKLIEESIFLEVLRLYKANLDNKLNDEELILKVQELIGSYEGFFFKKTIYKVK